ncbi:MAG: hypothetical protein ABIN36_02515 [Ferruginibacter sp.]
METFYKAYTKTTQNELYYFVKRYLSFPEYPEVEDVQEGYGMHVDFNKACSIAGINNPTVRKQLLDSIESEVGTQAKVIDLNPSESVLAKKIVH